MVSFTDNHILALLDQSAIALMIKVKELSIFD